MKYRKKPIVVEAFQFGVDDMPDWFKLNEGVNWYNLAKMVSTQDQDLGSIYCLIDTLEGVMRGDYGDYIIKGVHGELYPCKPEIFHQTYERCNN